MDSLARMGGYLDAEWSLLWRELRASYPDLTDADLLDLLEAEIAASGSLWRDGVEPLGIAEFTVESLGIELFPRQLDLFVQAGCATAAQLVSPFRQVQEVVAEWGKGSGKDLVAAVGCGWVGYVISHLKDPIATLRPSQYKGLKNNRIDILNVAPSGDQAQEIFFEYLTECVNSDLFREFSPAILTKNIHLPHINLWMRSLNSSAKRLEGYNTFAWVMDEADAFKDKNGKQNASRVHKGLRSSANTRWRGRWLGFVISYPRETEGFLEDLYKSGKQDPTYFVDKAATWDVNLFVSRDDPGIVSDYRDDPTDAAAKYECNPPPVEGGFFERPEFIEKSVVRERLPIAVVTTDGDPTVRTLPNGDQEEYVRAFLESVRQPEPGRAYYMGVDGAVSGDTFAVAIWSAPEAQEAFSWICPVCAREPGVVSGASYEEVLQGDATAEAVCGVCSATPTAYLGAGRVLWRRRMAGTDAPGETLSIRGKAVTLPRLREELVLEIRPQRGDKRLGQPRREVDFVAAQQVCEALISDLAVTSARVDPHQMVQMVQGLRDATGADVDTISFSGPEQYLRARLAKLMLYNGLLEFLPNERRDDEWRRLIRKNQMILHPDNGSKDIYDAETVCIYQAVCAHFGTVSLDWLFSSK